MNQTLIYLALIVFSASAGYLVRAAASKNDQLRINLLRARLAEFKASSEPIAKLDLGTLSEPRPLSEMETHLIKGGPTLSELKETESEMRIRQEALEYYKSKVLLIPSSGVWISEEKLKEIMESRLPHVERIELFESPLVEQVLEDYRKAAAKHISENGGLS